jgi:hypothetical protein
MVSLKDRRHSGRYTPRTNISRKELIANNIEIGIEYSDWRDHRDGFRDWYNDFKQIKIHPRCYKKRVYGETLEKRIRMNKKQELLLKRRRAKRMRNFK